VAAESVWAAGAATWGPGLLCVERWSQAMNNQPFSVVTDGGARMRVSSLTNLLEQRVQELLDAQVAATSVGATPLARRAAVSKCS
jgi:hypothetical protein